MFTENDVIEYVKSHLDKQGYDKLRSCDTTQQGYDIVAEKDGKKLYVEAKGQTSSKQYSNRFNKEFTHSQKKGHVAKAIYKAMKTQTMEKNCEVAIAFPSTDIHIKLIKNVLPQLKKLGILIFIVDDSKRVSMI